MTSLVKYSDAKNLDVVLTHQLDDISTRFGLGLPNPPFFFQRSDSQSYIRAQWDKDEGNLGCLDRIPNPTFPRKMPYFSSNIPQHLTSSC